MGFAWSILVATVVKDVVYKGPLVYEAEISQILGFADKKQLVRLLHIHDTCRHLQ